MKLSWASVSLALNLPTSGATDIPRKTNYDFERREREKTKAAEAAIKAKAKADKKAAGQGSPEADRSADPALD